VKSRLRKWFYYALLLSLCVSLPGIFAAEPNKPAKPQRAPTLQPSPAKVSGITNAAVKSGVLSCAGRVEQVANFLTANSRSGAILFVPPTKPDQQLVSASIEIESREVPLAYGSASFAPGMANGCGTMYEAVVYWRAPCEEIASRQFPGLKRVGVLSRSIAILNGGVSTRIFLMPAGGGCVSIKKEVVQ